MNILFWMNHPTTFNQKKDTTYLLVHECNARGHSSFYVNDIGIENNELIITAQKIQDFHFWAQRRGLKWGST